MNEDDRPCECICFAAVTTMLTASRGPSCRQPITSSKLFTLEAFNSPKSASSKKGKRRASARPSGFAIGAMDVDESESDSDDDFIVSDDEDYKPRRKEKKRAKRNVVLSDDEYDDVIIPAAKPEAKPKASAGEINEDEISTKMQVRIHFPRVTPDSHLVSEDDGRTTRIEEVKPRPEGMVYLQRTIHSLTPIQPDRCHLPVDRLPRHGLSVLDQRRIRTCEVSRNHVSRRAQPRSARIYGQR